VTCQDRERSSLQAGDGAQKAHLALPSHSTFTVSKSPTCEGKKEKKTKTELEGQLLGLSFRMPVPQPPAHLPTGFCDPPLPGQRLHPQGHRRIKLIKCASCLQAHTSGTSCHEPSVAIWKWVLSTEVCEIKYIKMACSC